MTALVSVSAPRMILHVLCVCAGSGALTLGVFLVLPLIQAINKPPGGDMLLRSAEAYIPPPDSPPEPEPEKEEEKEKEPPKLSEEAPPLDLSQLELALNPGFGSGWATGDFGARLSSMVAGGGESDTLFSLADLDQKPRAVYQCSPNLTAELRQKAPGRVFVLFIVDQRGRVENPIVQKSTDPIFEKPALAAVQKWRFEPGKRSGKPVRFRMRVPITFPGRQ